MHEGTHHDSSTPAGMARSFQISSELIVHFCQKTKRGLTPVSVLYNTTPSMEREISHCSETQRPRALWRRGDEQQQRRETTIDSWPVLGKTREKESEMMRVFYGYV